MSTTPTNGNSFMFLGYDLSTINWWLVGYVLACITIMLNALPKLYPYGMTRAILFGIGATLVFIFYGRRWFGKSSDSMSATWPPKINSCPDYLTYVASMKDGNPGCVDMLGVSTTGTLQVVGNTSTLSSNSPNVFPFTSAFIRQVAGNAQQLQAVCNACSANGITWEGVYDGDSCLGIANAQAMAQSSCPI